MYHLIYISVKTNIQTPGPAIWFPRTLIIAAMRKTVWVVLVGLWACLAWAQQGQYLFVWAGDDAKKSSDFLGVLDANPASPKYGQIVASVAVPGPTGTPHHTELEMPPGGFLLANAFESGRTTLFDLRDPLKPKVVTSYGGFNGYMHPHTYVRLKNGDILASFQYRGGHEPTSEGGGLVEFTQQGKFVRAGSAVDPTAKGELIRPYSLTVIGDRVVTTNTAMHEKDGDSRTIQIWSLDGLKLQRTLVLPPGPGGKENLFPGEPILAGDGKTVFIHTFNCGVYEVDGVATAAPTVRHLNTFASEQCDVPLLMGHYWVQTLVTPHAIAVYDISDRTHWREVSRVTLDDKQKPHWLSPAPDGRRIVAHSGEYGEHRIYMLNFDPTKGKLTLDEKFRDPGSARPGVSMEGKSWPHGFKGDAFPHGTVFSRMD